MDASSMDFRGRQVLGDDAAVEPAAVPRLSARLERMVAGAPGARPGPARRLGLTSWDPRVIHTSMGRDSYPVPYPTVQDGPLSETRPLTADATVGGDAVNYIHWLAIASIDDI